MDDELTILLVRDPDGDTRATLYRNGIKLHWSKYAIQDVDAGRGHNWEDWEDRISEARELPESDYRNDLLAVLSDPPGRGYINGWPEDRGGLT